MSDARLARLGTLAFLLISSLFVVGLAWSLAIDDFAQSDWGTGGIISDLLLAVVMFSFPLVGLLLVTRLPRNLLGWVLLGIGFIWGVIIFTDALLTYGTEIAPRAIAGVNVLEALTLWTWVPGIGVIATYLFLLFPDGKLPSPGWRPFAWITGAVMLLNSVGLVVGPPDFTEVGRPGVANPLHAGGLSWLQASLALLPLCMMASAWALLRRFRRSSGTERLQLKWFVAAAAVCVACFVVAMAATVPLAYERPGDYPTWAEFIQELSLVSFVLLPIATGIAILRYRLYDIDVVINRTIVYASLLVVLGLLYTVSIYLVGGVLRTLTGSKDDQLAVAASTLAVAAAFRPALGRIRSVIDRRFYRRRYDAMQVLEAFNARLRDQVSLDALSADLVGAVTSSMQPAHVSLWLKETGQPG